MLFIDSNNDIEVIQENVLFLKKNAEAAFRAEAAHICKLPSNYSERKKRGCVDKRSSQCWQNVNNW